MTDFIREMKLPNEVYYHWQNIKEEIRSEKLFAYNTHQTIQSIIYIFNDNEIADKVINFIKEQGFKVIVGEDVFNLNDNKYDTIGLKHYCKYNFDKDKFIKRESPYIPCIIEW